LNLKRCNLEITVTDKGMGVPIEDRKELFKPYFKSKNE